MKGRQVLIEDPKAISDPINPYLGKVSIVAILKNLVKGHTRFPCLAGDIKREPKRSTNWPCWIRHDWTPWNVPRPFGFELYQDSHCRKCGKYRQRNAGFATE